mgnify:FL=1
MPLQPMHKIWAILPAAGIGKRMKSDIPKQYLLLEDRPVLEHTIDRLLKNDLISGLVIALQEDDPYWHTVNIDSDKPVLRATGGGERSDSVLNAIELLTQHEKFEESDWVMVHDAVRPCLQQRDIESLVQVVGDNQHGGILALPVRDTIKKQSETDPASNQPPVIDTTVERDMLWHALTPQYFSALSLKSALQQSRDNKQCITDDASAMENAGFSPLLVHGHEDNIKITHPDDLRLAALYLYSQQKIDEQ